MIKYSKEIMAILSISLFLISMIGASAGPLPESTVPAITRENNFVVSQTNNSPGDLNVFWDQQNQNESGSWNWTNRNWVFGPKADYRIYFSNGTEIGDLETIPIEQTIVLNITIPRQLLGGKSLYQTAIEAYAHIYIPENQTQTDIFFTIGYRNESYEPWYSYSSINEYNMTSSDMSSGSMFADVPDKTLISQTNNAFFEINQPSCSVNVDVDMIRIKIVGYFTNDTIPLTYSSSLMISDFQGNGYYDSAPHKMLPIGISKSQAMRELYSGMYTLEKYDVNGDPIYSATRGQEFTFRLNISAMTLSYVMLTLDMPYSLKVPVTVYGWYRKVIHETGGWIYNETLDCYVYDENANITYTEEVYGPHIEYRDVFLNNYVTYTNYYRNYTTGEIVPYNDSAYLKYFYLYNYSSGTFGSYIGYTYWGVDPITGKSGMHFNITPVTSDDLILFNLTSTSVVNTTLGWSVTFTGYFTNETPRGQIYTFYPRVYDEDMYEFQPAAYVMDDGANAKVEAIQTREDFEQARQIAVETPVTVAKITKNDGSSTGTWFAHIDPGVPFIVQSYVQGASDIADDVDGAAFDIRAWTSKYGNNESIYTTLNYIIHILKDNTTEILAFNYTQKYNLTYGEHWEWVEVNKTDWHYEWNATLGDYVWVYGNYTEWENVKVTGWYWTFYSYDQSLHKWIQNANFEMISAQTKVNVSIFTINEAYFLDSPTLDVFMNLTVNSLAPQTSYMWNVFYLNNTWQIDYSQGWGEHVVTAWHRSPVWTSNATAAYFGTPRVGLFYGYNQTQYLAMTTPYIVIGNTKVPIKSYYSIESSGYTTKRLLYEEYNSTTGMWDRYYLGENGEKYYVYERRLGPIYQVNFTNGKSFLALNGIYIWNRYTAEKFNRGNTWILLNGTVVSFDYYEIEGYNYTIVDYINVDTNEFMRYVSIVNGSYYMEFRAFRWDAIVEKYYVITPANYRYYIEEDQNYGHYFVANGTIYYITWPEYSYPVDYNGTKLYYADWQLVNYYYTNVNGTEYQMPEPGTKALYWDDLDRTIYNNGAVPASQSIKINGVIYPIINANGSYYIQIDNSTVELTYLGWLRYFENCNHTIFTMYNGLLVNFGISGPEEHDDGIGVTALYGKLSIMNNDIPNSPLPVDVRGYLDITKDTNLTTYHGWSYDYDNGSQYITLYNGTRYTIYYGSSVAVYKVKILGHVYYGYTDTLNYNDTTNKYEYRLINGTKLILDDWAFVVLLTVELYPIFNVTMSYINGTYNRYYYVINGTPYIIVDDFEGDLSIGQLIAPEMRIYNYEFINSTSAYDRWVIAKPMYDSYTYLQIYGLSAANYTELLIPRYDFVYSQIKIYGWAYVYGPKPLGFRTIKSQSELIIGNPQYDMWGFRAWKTTETGALDLDGDVKTTNDQYYILQEYTSSDEWKYNTSSLFVDIWWNPNGTVSGDEVHVRSFMGLATQAWRFSWEYRFYWYHASDFTPVNATEMAQINSTILSSSGEPNPGYWTLGWYVRNMTWADIVQKAQERGWDWISNDWQTWSWIWFGFDEAYGTSSVTNTTYTYTAIKMRYEFAGLFIYNDTNNNGIIDIDPCNLTNSEVTHYFIPDGVDGVSFVLPGEAYGNYNLTGHLTLNVNDSLTFGITYYNVSGTFFPFGYGYWDWYSGMVESDMLTFDERPTDAVIDELTFLVHFNGYITQSVNNKFELKVDQHIGNFDVDILGGRAVLVDRSLGIAYYAEAELSQTYQVFGTNGTEVDNNQNSVAPSLSFGSGNSVFAEMKLGGNTYDWAKNTTVPINVTSSVTPVSTFEATYESEGGNSVTSFTVSSNQYYVTIGFPKWDGFAVFQDPAYVGYSSGQGSGGTSNPSAPTISDIRISNPSPAANEEVTIYATVDDPDGVQWVKLEYSTDGGFTWTSVDMTPMDGNSYQGTIPGQPAGTEVKYRIHAADTLNNEQISPSFSYVVASGTSSSSSSSSSSSNTNTGTNIPNVPTDLLIGGALIGAAMILLIVIIAKKRR